MLYFTRFFDFFEDSQFTFEEYQVAYEKYIDYILDTAKDIPHFVEDPKEFLQMLYDSKAAFAEYLNDVNLDADQIYFVNQIIEYIVRNGVMKDMSVLQEAPFTDRGSIVEVFTDISVWYGIKNIIDRINANAAA